MNPKFEAVFVPGDKVRFAEWQVIEWIYTDDGGRVGCVLERFGDCSGAEARHTAGVLQESYNREFYEHFG